MHMGLQDKLQHYAAPDDALVVGIDGPLTADAIVDAHLQALAAGRKLVLVHSGAPTPVALRTAARFKATLVDAASITVPEPMLPAPEPTLALPAHEEPAAISAEAALAVEAVPTPVPSTEPAPLPPAPAFPALDEGTLPWATPAPAAEAFEMDLDEEEFESMPWNVVHHQLLPAGRTTRPHHAHVRATAAPDWGLPWPRPVPPADALAIADPKLWRAQERIGAIREDLDRAGAPSFGVAKPDGSAWLKRLHEFGSP